MIQPESTLSEDENFFDTTLMTSSLDLSRQMQNLSNNLEELLENDNLENVENYMKFNGGNTMMMNLCYNNTEGQSSSNNYYGIND
jgi:hypothetical protein